MDDKWRDLPAGRALDALVADRVMGYPDVGWYIRESPHTVTWVPSEPGAKIKEPPFWESGLYYHSLPTLKWSVPKFSTVFTDALKVIELFEESNIDWILAGAGGQVTCHFKDVSWYDEDAALAICKAALMFLEKYPRPEEGEG